jgi:hypothetical protein
MMAIKEMTSFIDDVEGLEYTFRPYDDDVKVIKTEKGFKAGYLVQDDDPMSPDSWENEDLFLVAYHRDFWIERKKFISKDECIALFRDDKKDSDYRADIAKKYHVFGLEAYIHSGVRLALSNEGNFCDRQWDVSKLGCVFVSKEEWNMYLSGDVWGVVVEEYDQDKKQIDQDSCWGFYGQEYAQEEMESQLNFKAG